MYRSLFRRYSVQKPPEIKVGGSIKYATETVQRTVSDVEDLMEEMRKRHYNTRRFGFGLGKKLCFVSRKISCFF